MSTLKFKIEDVQKLIDSTQPEDKLMVVGDEGVYLMARNQAAPRTIVYAQGCNPEKDDFDSWWERKNATFGGDDGADEIGTNQSMKAMIAKASDGWLYMKFTSSSIDTYVKVRTAAVDYDSLPAALKAKYAPKR